MATRKDYVGIASAIKKTKLECPRARKRIENNVEEQLIKFFTKDNPLFDKDLFKEACRL
jgi:hypothetical protein